MCGIVSIQAGPAFARMADAAPHLSERVPPREAACTGAPGYTTANRLSIDCFEPVRLLYDFFPLMTK